MLTIRRSEMDKLGYDFPKAVDDFVAALTAHTKEEGTPAPSAPNDLVERAVYRAKAPGRADFFVADFVVDEDTTPAVPISLADKKAACERILRAYTDELAEAISPTRKRFLLQMTLTAAMNTPEPKRSADQQAVVALHAKMVDQMDGINWYLAHELSAIDDLTDATVDAWTPPPYVAAK